MLQRVPSRCLTNSQREITFQLNSLTPVQVKFASCFLRRNPACSGKSKMQYIRIQNAFFYVSYKLPLLITEETSLQHASSYLTTNSPASAFVHVALSRAKSDYVRPRRGDKHCFITCSKCRMDAPAVFVSCHACNKHHGAWLGKWQKM